MAIDATIGGSASNCYLTIAEATTLLQESRLYGSVWLDAPGADDDRESALRWATQLVDLYFEFEGTILTNEQSLRWPRYNAHDIDERLISQEVIPPSIKRAVAELALELLKRDRSEEPGLLGQGFQEAKVGSLSVKLDAKQTPDMIPSHIAAIVSPVGSFGAAVNTGGGSRTLRLRRS